MKVRPFSTLVLLGLAVALVGIVVVDRSAPRGPSACAKAAKSLDAGMIAKAQKSYAAILSGHPGSECAADGVWDVVSERCTRALTLAQSGATAEARTAYLAILAEDLPYRRTAPPHPRPETRPENIACAVQGLEDLPAAPAKAS